MPTTIKGVLSFPTLFTPKVAQGATEAKYRCSILIPPGDPQIAQLNSEIETAKANAFPSGFPASSSVCFEPYDTKYQVKDYYDPRFSGWYVFSCSAKENDKPAVVDVNHQPIVDPSQVFPGAVVWCSAGISAFTKGKKGIGGWLNGVMVTGEVGEHGRLDSKPTVEQMFANVSDSPTPAAPTPPTAMAPPPAPVLYQMTPDAQGRSREEYHAAGWSDEQLIQNGLMLPPNGVQPSFV